MVYLRTRPEFRSGTGSGGIWLVLVPVRTDRFGRYQTGTDFFHVVFRFYDELPASRAPSSSLAGSRAPLQFPDCITCYPPVSRLHHVLSSSSQTVSRATLEFTKCIMPPPPPPIWRHLERNIIFIFTVCYFY